MQHFERNVELQVGASIRITNSPRVFHQHRCPPRDAIDHAKIANAVHLKPDPASRFQSKPRLGAFPGSHQFMPMLRVSEPAAGNRLESGLRTMGVVPDQHFDQMDQFMLEDPL